ncbi:MAG: hypothetical protein IT200_13290 [Thermoleophilia bacterium]|nr:hypothetical protein [Thermoleophilia bacterium]
MNVPRRILPALLAAGLLAGCGGGAAKVATTGPTTAAPVTTTAAPPVTTPPATTIPLITAPPVTVTVTTPTTPAGPPRRPLRPGVPVASPARYTRDTALAFRALTRFSNTLRGVDSPSEFRSSLRLLRAELRIFDAAIRRLRGYQLESATLDGQRARLGRLGPPLARAMSNFLDAVRDGDVTAARRLANEIQRRLNEFRAAL